MTTLSKRGAYWTESKRVVRNREGRLEVQSVTCACDLPAALRKDCALVSGNKTPCRCACHRGARG